LVISWFTHRLVPCETEGQTSIAIKLIGSDSGVNTSFLGCLTVSWERESEVQTVHPSEV
jgi:hypothetical protein